MDLYDSANDEYDEESNIDGHISPENAFSFAFEHLICDFLLAEYHWYCNG